MMLTYFFVIIRCLKNKTQIFLAVCKIQCTFAAKLVFHNLYNHNIIIVRGISSDCSFPFFDVLNYHQIGWEPIYAIKLIFSEPTCSLVFVKV